MIFTSITPLVLGLLPFVNAAENGIHRLKLKKIPLTTSNPTLESAHLAQKYGAHAIGQQPLMGSGGQGRFVDRPAKGVNGEDLFWTQDDLNGGHGVPLTSLYHPAAFSITRSC